MIITSYMQNNIQICPCLLKLSHKQESVMDGQTDGRYYNIPSPLSRGDKKDKRTNNDLQNIHIILKIKWHEPYGILNTMVFCTPYPWYFDPPIHGISNPSYGIMNPLPMVYRIPYPCYIEPPIHGILKPYPWYFDPHSSMVYRTLNPWCIEPFTHGILPPPPHPWYIEPPLMVLWTPFPWYVEPLIHGILNPLSMVYRTLYPWYFDPLIHGISNPLPVVYRTPSNGIMNPLSMVYWTPYPWYIEPHGISNPNLWCYEPPPHGISNPNLWCKIRYGILNPVSKYHMVYWTRGRFFRGSKYHMTAGLIWGGIKIQT
jgi:hypothetical protein